MYITHITQITIIFIWAPRNGKPKMATSLCMLICRVCVYVKYISSLPRILYDFCIPKINTY